METDAEGISLVISALAGPAGGLLLLLFVRQFPRLAICAAVQSIFNLLPIYPLDGGRVLYGLVTYTLPHRNPERIVKLSGLTFILFISMACFVLTWQYRLIELAIFIAALLVIKSGILKFPCKERWLRVQ